MFDLSPVRRSRGKRALSPLTEEDVFSSFDSPLPYYSTIPKLKWEDARFLQLTRIERGDFSLLVDFLWQGCGAIKRADIPSISSETGVPEKELDALVKKLLSLGLLVDHLGRLVQPGLRIQYRDTLRSNQNKGGLSRSGAISDPEW